MLTIQNRLTRCDFLWQCGLLAPACKATIAAAATPQPAAGSTAGPVTAIGVGHIAGKVEKLGAILGLEVKRVC